MVQSIPGIGKKIAATIISEIGDIHQFHHAKQVAAYAGLDPSVFESGKFKASINHITKRGLSRLRQSYIQLSSVVSLKSETKGL